MQASFDPDATGPATAEEALSTFLAGWKTDFGGEIVYPRTSWGSLVLDGREVVTAIASPAPAGGFVVDTSFGCQGLER